MRRIYEFVCSEGHVTERYINEHVSTTICDNCCNEASKIISTPRICLDGTDPVFVAAADRWAKRHEEASRLAHKRNS